MACQPSDCILPLLKSSSSVCVGMYRFTYSLYYRRRRLVGCVLLMTPGLSKDIRYVYNHSAITCKSADQTSGYTNWAVGLVILHMVTSIFLRRLCGYIWVNIITLSPQRKTTLERERERRRGGGGVYNITCAL